MDKAITVSQLNRYIKLKFDHDVKLGDIYIRGEISNFTNHTKSGHYYFSLKDNDAIVKAVMFRHNAEKLSFPLKDGLEVIIRGQVSVFERDGIYQIYATEIKLDGEGDLAKQFEILKEKLKREGLFDEKFKKRIPSCPEKIGIITSPTGAAIKDIENVFSRRFPAADLFLYPALVQGDGASKTLIDGIEYFNKNMTVDVILLGRGGGSAEDLWCFNDENLARAIFNSEIPIVSCVGHEVDFTISDFVADLRAPTPSAAAELAVPDENSIRFQFASLLKKAERCVNNKIEIVSNNLSFLENRECLKSVDYYLENRQEKLNQIMSRPVLRNIDTLFEGYASELKLLDNKLKNAVLKKHSECELSIAKISSKVDALSPLKVLSRGYALATKKGVSVTAQSLNVDDEFSIKFCDGDITAIVKESDNNG